MRQEDVDARVEALLYGKLAKDFEQREREQQALIYWSLTLSVCTACWRPLFLEGAVGCQEHKQYGVVAQQDGSGPQTPRERTIAATAVADTLYAVYSSAGEIMKHHGQNGLFDMLKETMVAIYDLRKVTGGRPDD